MDVNRVVFKSGAMLIGGLVFKAGAVLIEWDCVWGRREVLGWGLVMLNVGWHLGVGFSGGRFFAALRMTWGRE